MTTAATANPTTARAFRGRRRLGGTRTRGLLVASFALIVASLAWTAAASAAPANDDFAAAAPISGLPFSDTVDTTGASAQEGEPQFCYFADQTVWYEITATDDATLAASVASSFGAYAQVNVYRKDGSGFGGLAFLGCQNFGGTKAVFEVNAGTTYYIQASPLFGFGGTLLLDLESVHAPANDDFANAAAIGSTPFTQMVDLTAASVEEGEPTSCQGIASRATAWYAFTPSATGSYRATSDNGYYGRVSAYTGSSLTSLKQVACGGYGTYFHADAGTTYYLQVDAGGGAGSPVQFDLDVAPAAQASFYYYPSDPSTFDRVQFNDYSYDPAGIGTRAWNLGDGFTSTDCCVTHRYASDGDYSSRLDITTNDGRTASATQSVAVKTHDVAITQFKLPSSGRVGRTKTITVEVNNSRYAETVQVAILRSVPGAGFEQVGQVTQGVPAQSAKRSTSFAISYTFSEQDAALGKVTFQAAATIVSARDANPADNTVTAVPVKVTA